MSQTIFLEFFDMVVDELVEVHCKYCTHEIENEETGLCLVCELSLELTESLVASCEA